MKSIHPEKDEATLSFAAGCIEDALELSPDDNLILYRYALVKDAQGEQEEAIRIMDRVIEDTPEGDMLDTFTKTRDKIAAGESDEGTTAGG